MQAITKSVLVILSFFSPFALAMAQNSLTINPNTTTQNNISINNTELNPYQPNKDSSIICLSCNELQESPKLKKVLQKLHNVRVNNLTEIIQNYPNQPGNSSAASESKSTSKTTSITAKNNTPIKNTAHTNHINPADTLFTIIHIGDSHIQGDYFSGEIRMQLQSYFGNAGRGILFPYALSKSFGPRGIAVKPSGLWTGLKTLSPALTQPLGLSGYAATTLSSAAAIQVSLTDKYTEENALGSFSLPQMQKINIWHSADDGSFTTQLNPEFQWTGSQFYPSGWGVSSYQSLQPTNQFNLSLMASSITQNHYAFFGFEIVPMQQRGLSYHHCGVVGAQFSHLINKAPYTIEQIAHIKPDIVIFSFGTNEAYNGKLDTHIYTPAVMQFIQNLSAACPNTAIILTTAPDTRSRNRIPPAQKLVNQQLREIAKIQKITLYDLNEAMGGWGSLHVWYQQKLTLADKLHFNAAGYALQGQLFTLSLLQAYNKINAPDTINIQALRTTVYSGMTHLVSDFSTLILGDSLRSDTAAQPSTQPNTATHAVADSATPKAVTKPIGDRVHNPSPQSNQSPRMSRGEVTHTVRTGENLYRIALRYHVTHEAISKRNKLKNPRSLQPGQRLVIPVR